MESPLIDSSPDPLPDSGSALIGGPELIAGRYELGALVGTGGMGEVYAGRDTKLDRAVALKFLRKDMASQQDLRSRFEAEARAAGRLSHPNVVGVFDTGEHDGAPYIVMELLNGRTLADEAATGPATEERARRVCREIVSALKMSHGQGVLHRDLKPGNVFLCHDGSVKVGDFGVAKMAEGMDLTQAGMMLGTPAYLAPERIAGQPATESTDVYAVGVILYELLAGKKPFEADTPLGLVRAIQDEPVPPLAGERPDIDRSFAAIVERAMARDPAVRYPSAAELESALQDSQAQSPQEPGPAAGAADPTRVLGAHPRTDPTLVSRPAGPKFVPPARWRRLSPRNRLGVIVAAVVLVVVFLVARNSPVDVPVSPDAARTPAPAETNGPAAVPAPLDEALKRLEEAVAP